jgi:hypothetical protein
MTSQTKHIFQPVAVAGAEDRILWKRFLCVFYVFWNWADTSTWLGTSSRIVTFFDDMMATNTTPKAAQLIVVIDTSALEPGNC